MATFGLTSIGANSDAQIDPYVRGSYHTPASAGTGVSIHAYVDEEFTSEVHSISGHLYDDTDNLTTNGETEVKLVEGLAPAWISVDFNVAPTIAVQQYLVCVWGDVQSFAFWLYYDVGDAGDGEFDFNTGNWTWPTSAFTSDANIYSIYVTYTPSGARRILLSLLKWKFMLFGFFITVLSQNPKFTKEEIFNIFRRRKSHD